MPNSEKKATAGLRARHKQEETELDPLLYEKQKVFNLVMDTSMAESNPERPSEIKETSFASLNNVENLFVTGDDRSSIANQMSRLSQGTGLDTDQSKVTANTFDKDTSFIDQ